MKEEAFARAVGAAAVAKKRMMVKMLASKTSNLIQKCGSSMTKMGMSKTMKSRFATTFSLHSIVLLSWGDVTA